MSKKTAHRPERRCVICGEHREKKDMLRIARDKDGLVRIDETGKLGGRGAYLCGSGECVNAFLKMAGLPSDGRSGSPRAKKSGKMERALRLSGRMDDELYLSASERAKAKAKAKAGASKPENPSKE